MGDYTALRLGRIGARMPNKNGGKWIRKERRLGIYLRDNFECQYCGRDLRYCDAREITLDHLEPRCMGGNNRNNNLVTACLSCNSSRAASDWRAFAPGGAIKRIEKQIRLEVPVRLAKAIIAGDAGDPRVENRR